MPKEPLMVTNCVGIQLYRELKMFRNYSFYKPGLIGDFLVLFSILTKCYQKTKFLSTGGQSDQDKTVNLINYALINRARGPYEEIFVLTFKAYGPNAVRSMRLECQCVRSIRLKCQNKYFPYGPTSRLIRALLYTYPNKTV